MYTSSDGEKAPHYVCLAKQKPIRGLGDILAQGVNVVPLPWIKARTSTVCSTWWLVPHHHQPICSGNEVPCDISLATVRVQGLRFILVQTFLTDRAIHLKSYIKQQYPTRFSQLIRGVISKFI